MRYDSGMDTKPPATPKTLQQAIRYFSDPDTCLSFMVALRWPDGNVKCPLCGTEGARFLANQRRWECREKHPRRQFSIKVGTIFEDSPLTLETWLPAVWLITNAKNRISSYEIHRGLDVTQKTAWFMLHRIRLAMRTGTFNKLAGDVEADESFVGGKAKFMHPHKRAAKIKGTGGMGKTAVMGLLERHGPDKTSRVRVKVIPTTKKKLLQAEVRANVEPGANLYTDALASYDGLAADYIHEVIDHAESYVRGKVHTNGLENFWSLLKRGIKGTYVSVEPWHLFRYLDEQAFRFHERHDDDAGRFVRAMRDVVGRRLTFAELTGGLPALA
jgi:hypothetical protein